MITWKEETFMDKNGMHHIVVTFGEETDLAGHSSSADELFHDDCPMCQQLFRSNDNSLSSSMFEPIKSAPLRLERIDKKKRKNMAKRLKQLRLELAKR